MGVKGLWSLLNPVARPVQIESMEGKRLAIDSSIWMYQFQATMRDKEGRVLVNAHVLGFLRRINKLLFHGIKPVFVFDGGAPTLKKSTIAERKRKKAGAAVNHTKVAEKLLAAQMRRKAVQAAQVAQKEKEDREAARAAAEYARLYPDEAGEQIAVNAVYLEELEDRPGPSRFRSAQMQEPTERYNSNAAPIDPEKRRKHFKKHDPYRLPETDIPNFSTFDKPDARLATEEELKQFVDDVHPEDIDIESAEFRALPTEVQYEIIGDRRIRSRQQSHRRLADMLRSSKTPLDFSKSQIKHLSQRNSLTQQLLTVTDMVGKAHLTIPVRIAAERNREYVLVKRDETEGGGWALGIREGTKEKPIEIEPDEVVGNESDDSGVEAISSPPQNLIDSDFRKYRRRQALEAITARYAPKRLTRQLDMPVKHLGPPRINESESPFEVEVEDDRKNIIPTANDEALALALQQEELGEDELEADQDLARALALSRREAERRSRSKSEGIVGVKSEEVGEESDDLEEVELVPSERAMPATNGTTPVPVSFEEQDTEEEFEEIDVTPSMTKNVSFVESFKDMSTQPDTGTVIDSIKDPITADNEEVDEPIAIPSLVPAPDKTCTFSDISMSSSFAAKESVIQNSQPSRSSETIGITNTPPTVVTLPPSSPVVIDLTENRFSGSNSPTGRVVSAPPEQNPPQVISTERSYLSQVENRQAQNLSPYSIISSKTQEDAESIIHDSNEEGNEHNDTRSIFSWSRSPTPPPHPLQHENPTFSIVSTTSVGHSDVAFGGNNQDDSDMAPADVAAESDDYARFVASIKNRDLSEVRREIDDEIRILNSENKVAMRDSDEITQAMIAQIQTLLRHFGIPYITAPMEAEAQCAKLAELDLVDGIITDDSDVFLFGGVQCFKNIFNDAKYAECFLMDDIERELMLSRERLISLAYFLGSDYTVGLPGIGHVMGLEILANFPGERGLSDFKDWWMRVQKGQDTEEESSTKWRKSFKKRFSKTIFLGADWPDPLVREAYNHPTVDESDEPFHWGFPKLSALRVFLHEELSWSISKVDDELTPIVQRIALRGKQGAIMKQATLDPFFDLSVGSSYYAPRRRGENVSKRLMGVIKQFKEAEARVKEEVPGDDVEGHLNIPQESTMGVRKRNGEGKRKLGDTGEESVELGQNKKTTGKQRGRKKSGTTSNSDGDG
ncbi:uncharacterized protein L203_103584 [Cryptococcus depauperatus CBS 7841]|uniref:Uncharacterized protein n=1 Tax=Cryptococcus depauperatus CBS 7841 TaxID=1295531 RepID=A0A1E3IKH6_9TREE|nr:DNA excision repair protein ERCC-5 [Cryptococcus depauperatus CBS 7841]